MELFLFRPTEYEKLYNCSGIVVDAIPLEYRRFVPEAWITIVLCAVYYILYIPCLISIWRHVAENTCYKLLFFIGIMDLAILWILGFLHGWLSLTGAVYCSYPTLIYVSGCVILSGWMIESSADLILALNRCLELLLPDLCAALFRGPRVYIWMTLSCFYGFYWLFFENPILFNGLNFAWFFNPFAGYRMDVEGKFDNYLQWVHDYTIGISCPLIYGIFAFAFWLKFRKLQSNIPQSQKMAFLQVLIFSAMNSVGCYLYVMMQHVEPQQWMITLAQINWLNIHGFPPVIYLWLNKTIRQDCMRMVYNCFGTKNESKVHGVTYMVQMKAFPNKAKWAGPRSAATN